MIYKRLINIPIFGNILRIINTYAYHGDCKSDTEFAPLWFWVKSFWASVLVSVLLTVLSSNHLHCLINEYLYFEVNFPLVSINAVPSDLIFSSFPSLLGFGIGVYALIFGLSNVLVSNIDRAIKQSIQNGKRKNGSVLMLNSDLAYPLLILTIAMAIAAFGKLYQDNLIVIDIVWFAFWFSIIAIIELVTSLFSLGENELLLKVSAPDENNNN